ncbi:hypothetical protein A2U01_0003543, partial [Trifolium medium]|nr:hypothetical protein [Trifolium medium]
MSQQEVPETQLEHVDPDEHLPKVFRKDIQIIKQAWEAMAEGGQPFTPYVSKQQKKKDKHLARSVIAKCITPALRVRLFICCYQWRIQDL